MSDLEQFLPIFMEETEENIHAMEEGLLALDPNDFSTEEVDTIFRAAHSIKGSSGMFNFTAISSFTHVMETFLDQFRNGVTPKQSDLELLFQSVDILKDLLAKLTEGVNELTEGAEALMEKFKSLMSGDGESSDADSVEKADTEEGEAAADTEATEEAETSSERTWHIEFRPEPEMMSKGASPELIIQGFEALGTCEIICHYNNLPLFSDFDPLVCYVWWEITLTAHCEDYQIEEVYSWCAECAVKVTEQNEAAAGEVSDTKKNSDQSTPAEDKPDEAAKVDVSPSDGKESGAEAPAGAKAPKIEAASSIRVDTSKIDYLINLVGELVITQSMLAKESREIQNEALSATITQLEQNTRELQESIMTIRMLPIKFAFNRFPRLIRDLSIQLNKKVNLKTSGEKTEIDKTVMEKIGDPLVHLVRNAVDHGIELPEVRAEKGKPEHGTILLNSYHQSGTIIIEIQDDGGGLNSKKIFDKAVEKGVVDPNSTLSEENIHDLIFAPGFSTADTVSSVSGRGVGMDVVRKNIQSIGGSVEVSSVEGEGSTFTIALPLTLAILDGQLFNVGSQRYIVPMLSIVESIKIQKEHLKTVGGNKMELYHLRDQYLPIVKLYELFGVGDPKRKDFVGGLLVVVEREGQKVGLLVDDLLEQQQVVIKNLEENYHRILGISGATILGDGCVALIIDVDSICRMIKKSIIEDNITVA